MTQFRRRRPVVKLKRSKPARPPARPSKRGTSEMRRRARTPLPPLPGPETALFLDVDGTLLDIAPKPDAVVMPDGLVATLNRLSAALGGALALVSGRRRADLQTLFRGADVVIVAEHGATASVPLPALEDGRGERLPNALVAALRRFAARHPEALLELKAHGAALHVRNAPAAAPEARRLATALAEAHRGRVRLLPGKAVFEFVADGISKGRAVATLMALPPFRGRLPYVIGDDVTDEDGFAAANSLGGISLRVGSSDLRVAPTAARFTIGGPSQLRKWLRGAADALAPKPGRARARNQSAARTSSDM
jgi:trehalose 6-phosphate phosphatase